MHVVIGEEKKKIEGSTREDQNRGKIEKGLDIGNNGIELRSNYFISQIEMRKEHGIGKFL